MALDYGLSPREMDGALPATTGSNPSNSAGLLRTTPTKVPTFMTASTATSDEPADVAQPDERPADPARIATVEGSVEGRGLPHFVKILFGITGISLVIYLVRVFVRFVLGYKRKGTLDLDGDRLRFAEKVQFVGREIRSSNETFSRTRDVLSVKLETRFPYLFTLLGLACLGFGVIAGIVLLLDGIQGEFTPWILSGVGLLLLGIVLDLVFTTIASSLPGKTTLTLYMTDKRVVRLVGCEQELAAKVVEWLHAKN